jgi:hypothetical protein
MWQQSFGRPSLETLEDRLTPAASHLAAPALGPALFAPAPVAHAHPLVNQVVPLSITNVAVQNGGLVANGLLGSIPFQAPLTLTGAPSTDPAAPAGTQILTLHLDPIHLNLLGLKVDTSAICLDITAVPGSGNLLGNLLAGVANSLNSGTSLGSILSGLGSDLNTLETGLTGILNGGLGAATGPSAVQSSSTNILHLALGPVDLNLLGLDVHLDNCANGPVTVDVSAQGGPGNLLGNLLGGLSHLLDSSAANPALVNKLDKIAGEILGLL